jgi:hypothetical protein
LSPVPFFFPLKFGFFYVSFTNITYILILISVVFFFINGPFWTFFFNINNIQEDLFKKSLFINNNLSLSFSKMVIIPLDFLVFFYKFYFFPFIFKIFKAFRDD